MDLSLSPSRSGSPTCAAGGIWLHSRYEPEREALRFAASEIGSARPSHVVILGPCLDYLSPALRAILPGATILSVQYAAFFARVAVGSADSSWYPDAGSSLDSFLDAALDEDAISGVAVLEWEPASRAFPAEALAAQRAVKASLDRLAASTATVKASGRNWIANACASFLLIEGACRPRPTRLPLLVAMAGPSLVRSLTALSVKSGGFATIAVSSALSACLAAGVEPDLVISTDGGFWSRLHLYPLAAKPLPLATPLTALPSSAIYRGSSLVLLDQGSFVESELLPSLCPALPMFPHGTVSGSALQLAAMLTDGPLIVAGLDLASFGEIDHARPHGFDALIEGAASRQAPIESLAWARSSASAPLPLPARPWRSSRSLSAYASALDQDSKALSGRLFRLYPSPVALPGFAEILPTDLGSLIPGRSSPGRIFFDETPLPPRSEREAFLGLRIASWRELAARASANMGGGELPANPLVAELLRSIDIVDYAAARRSILSGGNPGAAARDLGSCCESYLSRLERRFAS
jgi:hypothetical protein